jgi:hypothetical protein
MEEMGGIPVKDDDDDDDDDDDVVFIKSEEVGG